MHILGYVVVAFVFLAFVFLVLGYILRTKEAALLSEVAVDMSSVWTKLSVAASKDEASLRVEVSNAITWFDNTIKKIKL